MPIPMNATEHDTDDLPIGDEQPPMRKPAKRKPRKEPRPFVHGPVTVPSDLMALLVEHGKRNAYANRIRIAVTNCVHQSPGGKDYPLSDMWDVMGRWASSLRGMKQIEGITERHQAWEYIQRLRFAMDRAANDPTLEKRLRYPINHYLREALASWDKALAFHFHNNPYDLMSPDEYAGMEVAPSPSSVDDLPIFKRPPKPAPHPVRQEQVPVDPKTDHVPVAHPPVDRQPQVASLFAPKKSEA